MAKTKARNVVIKLLSTAQTGYTKTLLRPRQTGPISQVRYDPRVKRHVLFTESKRRKMGELAKPWDFTRGAFRFKK
ncbi:54S ribosomal protein L39, mitochondrial [Komagataella phaffii CBS 7435]|uniref:Large ribosomal subunit protein bL33m n=2 Tax=Komagataella phaffii TaxID=460519 RepID=C4R369_KOMPG|nr:mitochondrial 54S ribosomal protein YmL39 [Komagataella phaffii GS115]CAH2448951.1 54S ribosomal protein L39, mitochondrial [Komagataella phaffii CBS 7435]CAY71203.1 Mitochondrial ribosomal protein of the large subunit [Komagataella phaffii GS115]SCV12141.1 54S ribosomal protein L39, mitochondrial [Komagataella phaffii CBS 7435]